MSTFGPAIHHRNITTIWHTAPIWLKACGRWSGMCVLHDGMLGTGKREYGGWGGGGGSGVPPRTFPFPRFPTVV